MQNFISTFSPSKSFGFVNEQLCWEQGSRHCHDCHDPPHAPRVGCHDDRSPPRRLAAVARSDLCRTNRGQDYLRRDRWGEDGNPEEDSCALTDLSTMTYSGMSNGLAILCIKSQL